MAFELQIEVSLIDTEPEIPGNPGVVVRSERCSTMAFDTESGVDGVFVLCGARARSLTDDVLTDFIGQLEIAGRNVAAEGEAA